MRLLIIYFMFLFTALSSAENAIPKGNVYIKHANLLSTQFAVQIGLYVLEVSGSISTDTISGSYGSVFLVIPAPLGAGISDLYSTPASPIAPTNSFTDLNFTLSCPQGIPINFPLGAGGLSNIVVISNSVVNTNYPMMPLAVPGGGIVDGSGHLLNAKFPCIIPFVYRQFLTTN